MARPGTKRRFTSQAYDMVTTWASYGRKGGGDVRRGVGHWQARTWHWPWLEWASPPRPTVPVLLASDLQLQPSLDVRV